MRGLRGLVGLSIASMFVIGGVRLAGEPWGELLDADQSPLERFLDEAQRRIPLDAAICIETELFGWTYATRFHPRPVYIYSEEMLKRHPGAWRLCFNGGDFDPATARILEPHDHH